VSRFVKVSAVANRETRAITHGVSAFSGASLLLILQGSFGEFSGPTFYAAVFFAIALPLCISASLLGFIFGEREEVPERANQIFDWVQILGWVAGIVGFFQLILSFSGLLAWIFAIAVVFSFSVFCIVATFILRHEKQREADLEPEANRPDDGVETPPIRDPIAD